MKITVEDTRMDKIPSKGRLKENKHWYSPTLNEGIKEEKWVQYRRQN